MWFYFILKINYDFVTSVKTNGMQEPNLEDKLTCDGVKRDHEAPMVHKMLRQRWSHGGHAFALLGLHKSLWTGRYWLCPVSWDRDIVGIGFEW